LSYRGDYSVRLSTQAAEVFARLWGRELGLVRRSLGRLAVVETRRRLAPELAGWLRYPPSTELRSAPEGELVVLRPGYLRVVCEVLAREEVILVLAIVRRSELRCAVLGRSGAIRHVLGMRAAKAWSG